MFHIRKYLKIASSRCHGLIKGKILYIQKKKKGSCSPIYPSVRSISLIQGPQDKKSVPDLSLGQLYSWEGGDLREPLGVENLKVC